MARNFSLIVSLLLLVTFGLFAQDPDTADPDADKLKTERREKLIDAIVADANQLILPENRAVVSAKLGAVIWKSDPKRASSIFENAVGELISAQIIAEENKNPGHQFHDLLNSQTVRPMVLNTIAAVDAELALESLYRTRPTLIQTALSAGPTGEKIGNSSPNFPHLAQQEINLEQRFIRMVAEQRPERSLAFLKESVKKHLSGETMTMLRKIWEKDSVTGNELANDVADRLISRSFFGTNNQGNHELVQLSLTIVTEFMRERSPEERYINFDESRMRSLAAKLIATYLERGAAMGYIPLEQLEPVTKRFSPGSFAQLEKASENTRSKFGHRGRGNNDPEYTKLLQSNPTAETLIAEAKKFPVETRRSIYSSAANMLSSAGQYDRAVALLNENFEDGELENAISGLNWSYVQHLINSGEYDAAEALILRFNDNNRFSALISLATTIYNKNPEENKARAISILQQVRSLLPDRPETNIEFSQLIQFISTIATVEPSEGFRNLEPLIDQINRLTEALAIVNTFHGGSMRHSEYFMSGGASFGIHIDPATFNTFAKRDFARTTSLIGSFSRREFRILMLISLLERGL